MSHGPKTLPTTHAHTHIGGAGRSQADTAQLQGSRCSFLCLGSFCHLLWLAPEAAVCHRWTPTLQGIHTILV